MALENGAKADSSDRDSLPPILLLAVGTQSGDAATLSRLLFDRGVSATGKFAEVPYAFQFAVGPNYDVLPELIKRGQDVNQQLSDGDTLLSVVCALSLSRKKDRVRMLLNLGANPNIGLTRIGSSKTKRTAIQWARLRGEEEIEKLLKEGAMKFNDASTLEISARVWPTKGVIKC